MVSISTFIVLQIFAQGAALFNGLLLGKMQQSAVSILRLHTQYELKS
jgi:hypothetical protein